MKTKLLAFVLTLPLAASTALAADQTKEPKPDKKPHKEKAAAAKKTTSEGVYVTGSYIKQKVNKYGQLTDSPNAVQIIDRDTIDKTGATDIVTVLRKRGISR